MSTCVICSQCGVVIEAYDDHEPYLEVEELCGSCEDDAVVDAQEARRG